MIGHALQYRAGVWCLLILLFLLMSFSASAIGADFVEHELIVALKDSTSLAGAQALLDGANFHVSRPLYPALALFLVQVLNPLLDENVAIDILETYPAVNYAELNYIGEQRARPNDPSFLNGSQWALENLSGVDISAPEAWDITTGGEDLQAREIVVAVLDDGFDISHPDLWANRWENWMETSWPWAQPNVDDDGNGYVDDFYGISTSFRWNFVDPVEIPIAVHGTQMAGVIGAVSNNASMTASVNWRVKLMYIALESYTVADVLDAYDYLNAAKVNYSAFGGFQGGNVVAACWGLGFPNQSCNDFNSLRGALSDAGRKGILTVAPARNDGIEISTEFGHQDVPAICGDPNTIIVTSTTADGTLDPATSSWSSTYVQMAAPGFPTWTLLPGGNEGLDTSPATCFAAAHVAGVAALLYSVPNPLFHNRWNSHVYFLEPPDLQFYPYQVSDFRSALQNGDPIDAPIQWRTRLNANNAVRAMLDVPEPVTEDPAAFKSMISEATAPSGSKNLELEDGMKCCVFETTHRLWNGADLPTVVYGWRTQSSGLWNVREISGPWNASRNPVLSAGKNGLGCTHEAGQFGG